MALSKEMLLELREWTMDYVDDLYERLEDLGTLKIVTAISVGLALLWVAKKKLYTHKTSALEKRIAAKRQARTNQLDSLAEKLAVKGVLITQERKEILSLSAEMLIIKMKSGALSCVKVLHAYQAKAIEATRKCNCLVEFIEEAEEWSRAMESTPNQNYPLRGLPVSIKEGFGVANYDSTIGYTKFLGCKELEDSTLVATFKRLGAVPFCITNVPQNLISFSCSNPIYGATTNVSHPDRSPGGSSGGESALVASGASLLGVGSDIVGSLRIPAQFSGVPTFKPTKDRFSSKGQRPSVPGIQGLHNSPGLVARDVDSLILGAKAFLSASHTMHEMDSQCVPIPWREELFRGKGRLRIGYYDSSNVFPSTPGVKRAVDMAVKALKKAGHDLVPFECPDSFADMDRMIRLFLADEGKIMMSFWSDGPVDDTLYALHLNLSLSSYFKMLIYPFIRLLSKRACYMLFGGLLCITKCLTATKSHQLWEAMRDRQEFINKTVSRWKEAKLDLCLAPGFACPALPIKSCSTLTPAFMCTAIYNHLDFPTGSVLVTRETAEDQAQLETWDTQGDMLLKMMKKGVKGGEGLPLCVQLVGLHWEEEMVLRGMKVLQDALKAT